MRVDLSNDGPFTILFDSRENVKNTWEWIQIEYLA